jgi:hypothetical protein
MRNERGIILVTVMVLLLVVTFIGMISISTTTTGITIGGNKNLKKRNMHAGESGIEYSVPLIGETVYEREFPIAYDALRSASVTNIVNEITGNPSDIDLDDTIDSADPTSGIFAPDLAFPVGGTTVNTDIDFLYATTLQGSSIEYASGYLGVGKGISSAGAIIHYRINVIAQGALGSTARVGSIYRYIIM